MRLTIGTFNIQHGRNHGRFLQNGEEIIDLGGVAEVIRREEIAVCGLNEVRNQENIEGLCHQARVIAGNLGYQYVFARAIDNRGGTYGNALVSRYPIRSWRARPISVPQEKREENSRYEDRVLLIAELTVEDKPLTVMVCHFGLNRDEIHLAIEVIRQELSTCSGDVVLMGDFNLTPDTAEYAALAELLRDSAPEGEALLTFPSHAPEKKIDYLFVSDALRVRNVRVPDTTQSDHRPYVAELEW